jgi:uncharacterized protein YfaS (alpha-2-macroglobulin family)
VNEAGDRIADRRKLSILPATIEEPMQVSAWGGGSLSLAMAQGASSDSVELVLQPTLVEAALSNVRDLLEYPYGCLEQLISTTIPNVAVYRTLEKVNALGRLDAGSRSMLAEARSRSVQGIDRILKLEVKGGGFTWFHGYSTPSLPLTLIALDGLGYAIDAGLVEKGDPRIVESTRWLSEQPPLPNELEVTRTYVLSRLEGPRQAARVRALIDQVKPGDYYAIAIAVLSAEAAGIEREPGLQARIASLVQQSQEGYFSQASWSPDESMWQYPLRRVGLSAILAHAASKGSFDVAKARRRLVETLTANGELSTFDRGTALLHSLWLIERDAREMRAMAPPKVKLASGAPVRFEPRGAGLVATLPPGTGKLDVSGFEGVATLRARVSTPLANVKPIDEGMSIERSYWIIGPNGREKLAPGARIAQGQEVFVELKIDAHAGENWRSVRSAYYVVEDGVPAGFVPLIEDKEWRGQPWSLPLEHEALKRRSLDPEKATFFFEEPAWWSASPRVIGYVMRAQLAGHFVAPPAKVEDMYAPQVRGRTGASILEVGASDVPPAVATP